MNVDLTTLSVDTLEHFATFLEGEIDTLSTEANNGTERAAFVTREIGALDALKTAVLRERDDRV